MAKDKVSITKWHPFAERFRLLEGAEFDALVESIKATGGNRLQPILYRMVKGKPEGLAGRNRLLACGAAGVEATYKLVNVKDEDVRDFILRDNVVRRHMTAEDRRAIVTELRGEGKSTRQIAEKMGIGQATVNRDLAATEPGGSVGTVTGKDNRTRPASTGPRLLCRQCRINGAKPGCKECKLVREAAKKKEEGKDGEREAGDDSASEAADKQARSRNGQPKVNWKDFEKSFGVVVRLGDTIKAVLKEEKDSEEYKRFQEITKELGQLVKGWRKRLQKVSV